MRTDKLCQESNDSRDAELSASFGSRTRVTRPLIRRLFRISLRTMLLVMVVLCVLLGAKVGQAERQQEAVQWVHDRGGLVIYDYQWEHQNPDVEPDTFDVPPPGTTLAALKVFLEATEETNTPAQVPIDTEHWWPARRDLWNWWDPARPGYDPANRENVEWTRWSPDNAIKIAWRSWGRQIRVLPPANLIFNGDFEQADAVSPPPGWSMWGAEPFKVAANYYAGHSQPARWHGVPADSLPRRHCRLPRHRSDARVTAEIGHQLHGFVLGAGRQAAEGAVRDHRLRDGRPLQRRARSGIFPDRGGRNVAAVRFRGQ